MEIITFQCFAILKLCCVYYSQLITPKLSVTPKYLILHWLLTLHHVKKYSSRNEELLLRHTVTNNFAVARCFHAAYTPKCFKGPQLYKCVANLPEMPSHAILTTRKITLKKWWVIRSSYPKSMFWMITFLHRGFKATSKRGKKGLLMCVVHNADDSVWGLQRKTFALLSYIFP